MQNKLGQDEAGVRSNCSGGGCGGCSARKREVFSERIFDYDGFDDRRLSKSFCFISKTPENSCSLEERPGYLRLKLLPSNSQEDREPLFLGRSRQHTSFTVTAEMEYVPVKHTADPGSFSLGKSGPEAGVAIYCGSRAHLRLVVKEVEGVLTARLIERKVERKLEQVEQEKNGATLIGCENSLAFSDSLIAENEITTAAEAEGKTILFTLQIEAKQDKLSFQFAVNDSKPWLLADEIPDSLFCSEKTDNYVGVYADNAGSYCSNEEYIVDYDSFFYEGE